MCSVIVSFASYLSTQLYILPWNPQKVNQRIISATYLTHKQHLSKSLRNRLTDPPKWSIVSSSGGRETTCLLPLWTLSNRLPCVRSNLRWMLLSLTAKIGSLVTPKSLTLTVWVMSTCMATKLLRLASPSFVYSMGVGRLLQLSPVWMLFFLSMDCLERVSSKRNSSGLWIFVLLVAWIQCLSFLPCVWHRSQIITFSPSEWMINCPGDDIKSTTLHTN